MMVIVFFRCVEGECEFVMCDVDFCVIVDVIYDYVGIVIGDYKKEFVYLCFVW